MPSLSRVSANSSGPPLEDLMPVIENGHGNTLSLRVSAKFKRSDKYPVKPPVHIRLVSSSHCRTASCHHGSRILSPMEPRIPNEIPDPALDSALDRRTPLPQGILTSPVKQNALNSMYSECRLHSDHAVPRSRMVLRTAYDIQIPHVTRDPVREPG